jgi:hypothetical protein
MEFTVTVTPDPTVEVELSELTFEVAVTPDPTVLVEAETVPF